MAQKWQVPKEIVDAIDAAKQALEDFASDADMRWEDMSEKWQEGERGEAVRNWIETLNDQVDELETIKDAVEDATEPDF